MSIRSGEIDRAEVLAEALPYMQSFSDKYCVIKYGGSAMRDPSLAKLFAKDIAMLKQVGVKPIVVHGGGPDINRFLEFSGMQSRFVDGIRVTDASVLEVVEAVLCGSVNKRIVQAINKAGGRAVGICGKDDNFIRARRKLCVKEKVDLGYVGIPVQINKGLIEDLHLSGIIPVVAPVCAGIDCDTYNVNSDVVAGFLAKEMQAEKLLMLTDVKGVMNEKNHLVSQISVEQARQMIDAGVINGGMIPKVETCIEMVSEGCGAAHILDGRAKHAVLLELFTVHGCGTMIFRSN